jgi:Ca-activated chloride channel family protein
MKKIFLTIILFVTFAINLVVMAQNPTSNHQTTQEDTILKFQTDLIILNVTVQDKNGSFVSGLKADDFQVFDNKTPEKISFFSQESVPISLGLIIDTSGSMRFKLPMVIAAAKEMLKACKAEDEVFIVNMKDAGNIKLVQPYTSNFNQINKILNDFVAGGGTALLDGISRASNYSEEKSKNRRRALVVMSDGDDRSSTLNQEQLIKQLRQANTQVYLLGFPEGFVAPDGKFIDYSLPKAKKLLKKISEESGGETYFPTSLTELTPILDKTFEDLRTQYTIGYYPMNAANDKSWHSLEVRLKDKKLKYTIRTKTGYFANQKTDQVNCLTCD